ncbi:CAMK protein kinase [Diaporthe eres]|nr:CAMK protein kinase [Diaporthe eres]
MRLEDFLDFAYEIDRLSRDPGVPSPADHDASARLCKLFNAFANALDAQNTAFHECSAVQWAAEYGSIVILDMALRRGLDINNATRSLTLGLDPVLTAGAHGHDLVVAWFLDRGVDIARVIPLYVHQYTTPHYEIDESVPATSGSNTIIRKCHKSGKTFAQKSFHNVYRDERRRMLREIAILKTCKHPNLTGFIDAYEDPRGEKRIHIVITSWAPCTLRDFLLSPNDDRHEHCPWFEIDSPESHRYFYRILFEISDAVSYLHRLFIKHKDIKPDNILLHKHRKTAIIAILTDFGVRKVYRRGYRTNYNQSSYPYLAPEQLRKEESSFSADVWQLGCCSAMLLVVARGGSTALDELWTSFERTEEGCTCCIAGEHASFTKTLQSICSGGDNNQIAAHQLVTRTLALDFRDRPVVQDVCVALRELVYH